ncbi:MAG: hypothetical protein BRC29_04945 [Nanohaloarchaea archaeon SW_7_43_1]|nr:MAG: hypothetical protein BRC29_04945 [Nanohaloarchaea archaeon SW_7_43_1]
MIERTKLKFHRVDAFGDQNLEELTRKLVKFRTVEDNSNELEESTSFVKALFESENLYVKEFESGKKPSLLISTHDTMKPDILLHGHLDVVSADKRLFEPEEKNGKLYGRGTADMKGGVACVIKTMKKINEKSSSYNVAILLTTDEELGGFNGTGYLVDRGLKPGFVISAEPDDSGNFPSIVTRQKGVLQLKVVTEGESAHASKPEKGVNAAEILIDKYQEIKDLFSDGDFPTTINLGKLEAGNEVNKVPEEAQMNLDVRCSRQYTADEVLKDIRSIKGINVEITARAPMMEVSPEDSKVRELAKAAGQISGNEVELRKEDYASDMRFFTSRDIPAVCFGPEGYHSHSEKEYVELDSMDEYVEIIERFIMEAES